MSLADELRRHGVDVVVLVAAEGEVPVLEFSERLASWQLRELAEAWRAAFPDVRALLVHEGARVRLGPLEPDQPVDGEDPERGQRAELPRTGDDREQKDDEGDQERGVATHTDEHTPRGGEVKR